MVNFGNPDDMEDIDVSFSSTFMFFCWFTILFLFLEGDRTRTMRWTRAREAPKRYLKRDVCLGRSLDLSEFKGDMI
jgi:hypothetical protein